MPEPEDLSFDAATAVRQTGDPAVFEADVHPLWAVGDKPNGGYLLALLGRAARTVARAPAARPGRSCRPRSPTCGRPQLGPATVRTTLLRSGRTAAHVRAVLVQDEHDLVDAVFVLGDLPDEPTRRYDGTDALPCGGSRGVRAPHPEDPAVVHVGIMDVLDLRLDPATVPFAAAPPPADTVAELRGWTRFADGREPDALSLLFFADAIPPATFMIGSTGWVPDAPDVRLRPGAARARGGSPSA